MRYLKLYEDHNNYYYQIEADEFDEATGYDAYHGDGDGWITTNWVDFNQSEIDTIRRMFTDYFVFVGYSDFNQNSNGMIIVNNRSQFDIRKDWSGTLFYVIKLPDEWYYTVDFKTQIFYKCDQFGGLLKFIEDKFLS